MAASAVGSQVSELSCPFPVPFLFTSEQTKPDKDGRSPAHLTGVGCQEPVRKEVVPALLLLHP